MVLFIFKVILLRMWIILYSCSRLREWDIGFMRFDDIVGNYYYPLDLHGLLHWCKLVIITMLDGSPALGTVQSRY